MNDRKILDLSFSLSNVSRWIGTPLVKNRSVSEHSYRVAILSYLIYHKLEIDDRTALSEILSWSLFHDLPEAITGDIPHTVKRTYDFKDVLDSIDERVYSIFEEDLSIEDVVSGRNFLVKDIVKTADLLDLLMEVYEEQQLGNKHPNLTMGIDVIQKAAEKYIENETLLRIFDELKPQFEVIE